VSQRCLGENYVSRLTIKNEHFLLCEKTRECYTTRYRQRIQTICAKNLQTCYIDLHVACFWTMKNYSP